MNELDYLNNFVSDCAFKTSPMKVFVTDNIENTTYNFTSPAGFRLEQFAMDKHPEDCEFEINTSPSNFTVKVRKDDREIAVYHGEYF